MWKSLETFLWLKGHLIELKTVKNPEKLLVSANLFQTDLSVLTMEN